MEAKTTIISTNDVRREVDTYFRGTKNSITGIQAKMLSNSVSRKRVK
jgi:hypothetical protein